MTPTTSTPVGIDGLSANALSALQAIRSHSGRPVSAGVFLPDLGLTKRQWERARNALLTRGLITAIGEGGHRTYTADVGGYSGVYGATTRPVKPKPTLTVKRAASAPTLTKSERRILRLRIVDHLERRRLDETTLASWTGSQLADVRSVVAELVAAGTVRRVDGGLRA